MSYRIAYTNEARSGLDTLSVPARKDFNTRIADIARNPYGCGSTAVRGDRERRDAAIGHIAIIRYEVSPSVVTVTVLRVISL
ncbi:hypothetical protein ACFRI7_09145 [Streptomyces sp. NPDC056716]|uniref:hypothetical protein n=1 Tax=unclassified Streptomyces TaxID=2593676 RepID=UPI0036BAE7F2